MAHGHSPEKIAEEMRTVKAAYLASVTPEQAKGLKDQSDEQIAESAWVTCCGFLGALTNEAKERQQILDEHAASAEATA
jgi:hypothetical protein